MSNVICGAMSHMCIDATTRAAFDYGFNCFVVEDACTTRDLEFRGRIIEASDVHASFMAALSIPYAQVLTTKEALDIITEPLYGLRLSSKNHPIDRKIVSDE